ncbi:MAG: RdgB/HAM1 family non-canonical purine NTP pyrophosphatase [Christensenellales bacterium]
MDIEKLVIASNNSHKIQEIKAVLGDKFREIVGMKDAGLDMDIVEDGDSFYANALIKAKAVSEALNLPALADDSGLVVPGLSGEPGIYSARYAGEPCSDERNNAKLLRKMESLRDRSAKFVTVMVLIFPDGRTVSAEGAAEGRILTEPDGDNGFGYDPLFYSTELGKTFAKATMAEKNSVSHRSRALQALLKQI